MGHVQIVVDDVSCETLLLGVESAKFRKPVLPGMKLEIFNTEGDTESILTAKYVKMGDGSTELVAKDSVVVINKRGETLNTEHLIWDKKKSIIKTEGFVKIHTEDEIIYGDGFESNDDFTEYTITNIHGIVKVKEEE